MATHPRLMIVIGQVLTAPWLDISMAGQFPTWLPIADKLRIPVRHSHGRRSGRGLQAFDRAHEWVRWRGIGQVLVPRLDSWVGRRYRDHVPDASIENFQATGATAWSQNLRDVYALQRWKVLGSLRQALREDFDFVYFTTASSYVRPAELLRIVASLPSSGVYAGTRHVDGRTELAFASGANRVLSRDVAELVVRERRHYRIDVMEDVGLGALIMGAGIGLLDLPSVNVSSQRALDDLDDGAIEENFHFRMTSGSRKNRTDAELMRILHKRVLQIESRFAPTDHGK